MLATPSTRTRRALSSSRMHAPDNDAHVPCQHAAPAFLISRHPASPARLFLPQPASPARAALAGAAGSVIGLPNPFLAARLLGFRLLDLDLGGRNCQPPRLPPTV